MNVNWGGISYGIASLAISFAAGWFGQPLIHENKDAIGVIVNVFSILAGFLVAIMTILGDPGVFRGRTWRSDEVRRSNMFRRLVRHKHLFQAYLVVLLLIFVTTLMAKSDPCNPMILWLERGFLSLACFAFMLSIMLPGKLMEVQLSRLDEMIEERKTPGD